MRRGRNQEEQPITPTEPRGRRYNTTKRAQVPEVLPLEIPINNSKLEDFFQTQIDPIVPVPNLNEGRRERNVRNVRTMSFRLSRYGVPPSIIADIAGVNKAQILMYKPLLDMGKGQLKLAIFLALLEKALVGKDSTALIYLSKAICGLKEESGVSEETRSKLDAFITAVNTKSPK